MSRHLVEWLLRNPVPLPEVQNVGEDRTWRVLMSLADYATEDTGLMWASDRSQEKDTGLNRRSAIQPVRKVLEEAGWLIDTGKTKSKGVKVFELVVPGYTRPLTSGSAVLATEKVAIAPSGSASGSGSGSGSGSAGLAQTKQNRTSLSVNQKDSESQDADKQRREIERLVIEFETTTEQRKGNEVGVPYQQHWRKEYRPIIAEALLLPEGKTTKELAEWSYQQRHGKTAPRIAQAPKPKAQDCDNACTLYTGADDPLDKKQAYWDEEVRQWFACPNCNPEPTQAVTTKRVTTNQSSNTHIPTPSASADPQLARQVIKDLSRTFRTG